MIKKTWESEVVTSVLKFLIYLFTNNYKISNRGNLMHQCSLKVAIKKNEGFTEISGRKLFFTL